jgi:hypothetical protein
MFIVRSPYQGTAVEDTAAWKKAWRCCDEISCVEISDNAVIAYSSEWCVNGILDSFFQWLFQPIQGPGSYSVP